MKNSSVYFEIPTLQEILDRLEKIDARLESVLFSKLQSEVWLNSKDAAKALRITTRTLATYRDQGVIPFSQHGRLIRYRASDLQEFLLSNQIKRKGGVS